MSLYISRNRYAALLVSIDKRDNHICQVSLRKAAAFMQCRQVVNIKKEPMRYEFHILVRRSIILLLLLMSSLTNFAQSEIKISTTDKSIQQLLDWRIVGPFKDTLRNIRDLETLTSDTRETEQKIIDTLYHQKGNFINLEDLFKTTARLTGYAVCKLLSDRDEDVIFFINADDELRCWINDVQVFTVPEFTQHEAVMRKGHLRKGVNTLVFEIRNLVGTWGFDIDITTNRKAQGMVDAFLMQIPQNNIKGAQESQIQLKNWKIIGPFTSTLGNIDINQLGYLRFIPENTGRTMIDTLYKQENDVIDLGKLFGTDMIGMAYAVCDVIAEEDQEMAFLVNADDQMRLWKDNSKVLSIANYTAGQAVIKKIKVKKGMTRLIAEIRNTGGSWSFDVNVCGFEYARKNALLPWYYSSSYLFIVPEGGALSLGVIDTDFVPINNISTVKIFDARNRNCYTAQIDLKKGYKFSLPTLSPGAYRYELYTDRDTLTDFFCYGTLEHLYNKKELVQRYEKNRSVYTALLPYMKRLDRLLSDYSKAPEVSVSKKIVYCIYKVNEIDSAYQYSRIANLNSRGLSLRMFTSVIDGGEENYLLYIPERVKELGAPLPLVVMVPYVTYSHPFYTGGIVANTERITYISKFAERYGMAVLWPSSRIFRWYNQTPIVTKSIIESIEDACKHYNIDKKHMFLYGDCSGGLFAFQAMIRRPDLFAAIGVEGPELTTVEMGDIGVSGLLSNSLFDLTDNLYGKSAFILHSSNDQKAPIEYSRKLMNSISRSGGKVYYDDLRSALKSSDIKRYSEAESMSKLFSFFNAQKDFRPDPIRKIATYGFYNDTVYGVFIKEKVTPGKATVSYHLDMNRLVLTTINVHKLIIDKRIVGLNDSKSIAIFFNGGRLIEGIDYKAGDPIIELTSPKGTLGRTTSFTKEVYGPINKVFLNNFAIVKPVKVTEGAKSAISIIDSLWVDEYRNHILIIDEKQVNSARRNGVNLVYIVNDIGYVATQVLKLTGMQLRGDSLMYMGNSYLKNKHSFAFYIKEGGKTDNMYLSLNGTNDPREMLKSLFIKKGWYDFEMWNGEYPIIQSNYREP